MTSLRDRFFQSILLSFTVLTLLWGVLLPIHEGPDEPNHYRYIFFLKSEGRLPRQLPLPPEAAGEGHQPPLYYALQALALKVLDPGADEIYLPSNPHFAINRSPAWFLHPDELRPLHFGASEWGPHLLRIVQLWMPLLSLTALWIFLASLPVSRGAARIAFALIALNPGFVFLSGMLNNDHAGVLFFSLSLLVMADACQQKEWNWGHSVACGLFLGLGALSKMWILCLFPLGFFVAWIYGRLNKAWGLLAIVAGIAGWFYVRNVLLYGDPLGWHMYALTCPDTIHPKAIFDMRWWLFWTIRSFESFWIVFGWMSWTAPRWLNAVFLGFCLAALAGLRGKRMTALGWVLVAAAAGLTLMVMRFNLKVDPPAGRFFYPLLMPLGAFFAVGFDAYAPLRGRLAPLIGAGSLAILNAWILFDRLIPLYYGT